MRQAKLIFLFCMASTNAQAGEILYSHDVLGPSCRFVDFAVSSNGDCFVLADNRGVQPRETGLYAWSSKTGLSPLVSMPRGFHATALSMEGQTEAIFISGSDTKFYPEAWKYSNGELTELEFVKKNLLLYELDKERGTVMAAGEKHAVVEFFGAGMKKYGIVYPDKIVPLKSAFDAPSQPVGISVSGDFLYGQDHDYDESPMGHPIVWNLKTNTPSVLPVPSEIGLTAVALRGSRDGRMAAGYAGLDLGQLTTALVWIHSNSGLYIAHPVRQRGGRLIKGEANDITPFKDGALVVGRHLVRRLLRKGEAKGFVAIINEEGSSAFSSLDEWLSEQGVTVPPYSMPLEAEYDKDSEALVILLDLDEDRTSSKHALLRLNGENLLNTFKMFVSN